MASSFYPQPDSDNSFNQPTGMTFGTTKTPGVKIKSPSLKTIQSYGARPASAKSPNAEVAAAVEAAKSRYMKSVPIDSDDEKPMKWPHSVAVDSMPVLASVPLVNLNAEHMAAPAPVAVMGVAPIPVPQPAPAPVNLGSLRAFVGSGAPFEESQWTPNLVSDALAAELWRVRDAGEMVKEGDILSYETDTGPAYEHIQGWKDMVIKPEDVENHACTIWTLEGGGKPRKPVVYHETSEYSDGMMGVAKGQRVNLPTSEDEARRFFKTDVFITETSERGKRVKVFVPLPVSMANRRFRRVFSRIFPDVAKRLYRDHIKGLIDGRGDGVHLPRKVSVRRIIDMIDGNAPSSKERRKPLSVEEVSAKLKVPMDTINRVLARRDYVRREDGRPTLPFLERMEMRKLTPAEYGYDKSLGVEIEVISKVPAVETAKRMPSYAKVIYDGSLRSDDDKKLSQNGGNSQADLATGYNGEFGMEYQILIKRSEMEARVIHVVNRIHATGARVNKSCGLHVHFDMRDKTAEQAHEIGDKVSKWLGALRDLLPPSRRANKYCAFENADSPHHQAVGTYDPYKKHKTIEVRVHSSTLNTTKIIHWIRLCETIMETRYLPPKTCCLDALKMLNLTEADRAYWLKRHQQVNPEQYRTKLTDLSFLGDKAVNEIE